MNFYLDFNDRRLPYVYDFLKNDGYKTYIFSDENISKMNTRDVLVLSPAYKWKEETAKKLNDGITIVCGNISSEILDIFNKKQITYFNLMKDENFVLKNAILTAEGMLCDLILNTKTSILESKILVLGGGRVAKSVAVLFNKLGLNFDISMRNELKLVDSQLFCTNIVSWKNYKNKLKQYDVVINTIPANLFNQEDVEKFKDNCIVFELASSKCLQDVKFEKFSYVLCPALPSKYTPESAGKLIYKYLINHIKGEN